MDLITIILLAALVLGYFAWYRPTSIVRPVRERKELVTRFEQATNLNQQVLADVQQYAQNNSLLDKPFMEGDSFRKKITELEVARDEFFNEENYLGLRARNPKNLDIQLMSKTLDDQFIYHERIQKALIKYKNTPAAN
jgi:hypothetical protein